MHLNFAAHQIVYKKMKQLSLNEQSQSHIAEKKTIPCLKSKKKVLKPEFPVLC